MPGADEYVINISVNEKELIRKLKKAVQDAFKEIPLGFGGSGKGGGYRSYSGKFMGGGGGGDTQFTFEQINKLLKKDEKAMKNILKMREDNIKLQGDINKAARAEVDASRKRILDRQQLDWHHRKNERELIGAIKRQVYAITTKSAAERGLIAMANLTGGGASAGFRIGAGMLRQYKHMRRKRYDKEIAEIHARAEKTGDTKTKFKELEELNKRISQEESFGGWIGRRKEQFKTSKIGLALTGSKVGQFVEGMQEKVSGNKHMQTVSKGLGMVGGLGAGIGMAGIVALGKAIIDSSPILQVMLKLMSTAVMFILRPIGDFFGILLRPLAVAMLKHSVKWYRDLFPKAVKLAEAVIDFVSDPGKGFVDWFFGTGNKKEGEKAWWEEVGESLSNLFNVPEAHGETDEGLDPVTQSWWDSWNQNMGISNDTVKDNTEKLNNNSTWLTNFSSAITNAFSSISGWWGSITSSSDSLKTSFDNLTLTAEKLGTQLDQDAWAGTQKIAQKIIQDAGTGTIGPPTKEQALRSAMEESRKKYGSKWEGLPWVNQFLDSVPKLGKGGTVTEPTAAVIGESGPEAVVPLDRYDQLVKSASGSYSNPMFFAGGKDLRAEQTRLTNELNTKLQKYGITIDQVQKASEGDREALEDMEGGVIDTYERLKYLENQINAVVKSFDKLKDVTQQVESVEKAKTKEYFTNLEPVKGGGKWYDQDYIKTDAKGKSVSVPGRYLQQWEMANQGFTTVGGYVGANGKVYSSAQEAAANNPPGSPVRKLATGGVFDTPTNAVVGESGPEAVIPLSKTGFNMFASSPTVKRKIGKFGGISPYLLEWLSGVIPGIKSTEQQNLRMAEFNKMKMESMYSGFDLYQVPEDYIPQTIKTEDRHGFTADERFGTSIKKIKRYKHVRNHKPVYDYFTQWKEKLIRGPDGKLYKYARAKGYDPLSPAGSASYSKRLGSFVSDVSSELATSQKNLSWLGGLMGEYTSKALGSFDPASLLSSSYTAATPVTPTGGSTNNSAFNFNIDINATGGALTINDIENALKSKIQQWILEADSRKGVI